MTEKSFANKSRRKGSNPTRKQKRAPKGARFAKWIGHGYEVPNKKHEAENTEDSCYIETDDNPKHVTVEIDFSYVGWILLIISFMQIILDNYGQS